jgi:uncharacterized protein (TIGR01777 family)
MKALITGATGFIGKSLLARLEKRVVLTRNVAAAKSTLAKYLPEVYAWNAEREQPPADAFEGVEAVFHLAGDPVAEGRWNAAKKQRMRDSRIAGTRNLVNTLLQLRTKPRVLVAASAVGFYGDRGEEILDERSPEGKGFLTDLCRDWETEAQKATQAGIRVVNIRIGIVLGNGGGALDKMLLPFRLGVGSALGSGRQYMPWIHLDDLVDLMAFAAEHDSLSGPVNGVAPNPVTNAEFTKSLGRALRRPTFFPAVPAFALRMMLGEFGDILLHSQRVIPRAALNAGFQFRYEHLDTALQQIISGETAKGAA